MSDENVLTKSEALAIMETDPEHNPDGYWPSFDVLDLSGVTEITDDAAKVLNLSSMYEINLGVTKLSDEAAKCVARFNTQRLVLESLQELSEDAAKSLITFDGQLVGIRLETLSKSVARILRGNIRER